MIGLSAGSLLITTCADKIFPNIPQDILIIALATFPITLCNSLAISFFQAFQDFKTYNLVTLTQPLIGLLGIIGLSLSTALELKTLIFLNLISQLTTLAIALNKLSTRLNLLAHTTDKIQYITLALTYGIKAHIGNTVSLLNYRADLILVNYFSGPAAAGIYNVAIKLAEQLLLISKAFSTVLFPTLASLKKEDARREKLTPKMARSALWASLIASMLFAGIADPLISTLLDKEFSEATSALLILLPGIVAFTCAQVLANDFAARGMIGTNLVIACTILAVNISLNISLIPPLGIEGAAFATSLAYAANLILRMILQWKFSNDPWWSPIAITKDDMNSIRLLAKKHILSLKRNTRLKINTGLNSQKPPHENK